MFTGNVGNITVSNSFNATEVLFDPQIKEVVEFKSKLPNDGLTLAREDFDSVSTPPQVNLYDEFFVNNRICNVRALNLQSEVYCFDS